MNVKLSLKIAFRHKTAKNYILDMMRRVDLRQCLLQILGLMTPQESGEQDLTLQPSAPSSARAAAPEPLLSAHL